MLVSSNGYHREPVPGLVVRRLKQLHVPVKSGSGEPSAMWVVCAYDGFTWPCREIRIIEGYEEQL